MTDYTPSDRDRRGWRPSREPGYFVGKSPEDVCQSKKVFGSRRTAKQFARRVAKGATRPYRCPVCGNWHLTTAGARTRSRLRVQDRATGEGES